MAENSIIEQNIAIQEGFVMTEKHYDRMQYLRAKHCH